MKNRTPQIILPHDEDRAAFKKRCIELLRPLEDEFGIKFEFGCIDQIDSRSWDVESTAKMKCYFHKVKKPTPHDS